MGDPESGSMRHLNHAGNLDGLEGEPHRLFEAFVTAYEKDWK